jgi:hypothetical protein
MQIPELKLAHRIKSSPQDIASFCRPYEFSMDTCQRQVWLSGEADMTAEGCSGFDIYRGSAAYEKLLAISCGLESRVIGETEVFAQLRKAWREHEHSDKADSLFTALFEDTKYIRTHYLTGLGGQSYGTLLRKYFQPDAAARLLIAGAGELAAAILPIFADWEVTITNRSIEAAETLRGIEHANGKRATVTLKPDESAGYTHIIICRPFDPLADECLMNLPTVESVAHLGASQDELASLQMPAGVDVLGLDDIFALQASQDKVRQGQIKRARRVCRERARLRGMGSSICLPHGWEDLAAFG